MTYSATYCAQRRYYERTVDRLKGILAGISSDYILHDGEIAGLYKWVNEHEFLRKTPPFDELFTILDNALADQVIDPDEREERKKLRIVRERHFMPHLKALLRS